MANKKLRDPTAVDKGFGKGRGLRLEYWAGLISKAIGDGLLNFKFNSILVSIIIIKTPDCRIVYSCLKM